MLLFYCTIWKVLTLFVTVITAYIYKAFIFKAFWKKKTPFSLIVLDFLCVQSLSMTSELHVRKRKLCKHWSPSIYDFFRPLLCKTLLSVVLSCSIVMWNSVYYTLLIIFGLILNGTGHGYCTFHLWQFSLDRYLK